ncbi:methyltransferase domain-containing protein [Candidatus Parcubacteria bacterium]|nr:methyltransferase domain-containing protein [Candidatus Parcubacteria bacterium]
MNKIKTHFSKTVDDYDTVANKVVFKNNELHNELINAISFNRDKKINILDLGSGTGHGMELVAKRFPKAKITGIDFSPIMIEKAKKNLLPFSNRIKLLEIDFRDYDFNQKFDVVISAIAIHNITHKQKKWLFEKIFNSLNDGGLFINADFYEHESKIINDRIKAIYKNFLRKNLSGDELKTWLRHAFEEDMPMSLTKQTSALKKIGFDKFKLLWIFNNEIIYIANK